MKKNSTFLLFSILLMCLIPLSVLSSCGKEDKMRSKVMEHLSSVYEVNGDMKIDTVLFLNSSIPALVEDSSVNLNFNKTLDNLGGLMLMMAFSGIDENNMEDHKEEVLEVFEGVFEPVKKEVDSLDKVQTPKQKLALVKLSSKDTTAVKVSKIIYILDEDKSNPIADSIRITKAIQEKVEIYGFMKVEDKFTLDMNKLEDKAKQNIKNPVLKFIVE